ncbi:fuculose-phosphate aldolase [Fusarium coicis]|nr:fuculose-phosphate aldolase [Fusarium coicis]
MSSTITTTASKASLSTSQPKSRLHQIPQFHTPEATRRWQLEQMAGAFRIFARLGFADGGSGHISLRDPVNPDTFWLNPYGVHFGLLKVSDMVHVNEDGERIGGADSPYGRAWSTFGKPIDMLNQDSCMFYNDLAVYANFGGVVFAKEEGMRLADTLGPTKKNLILQNHGILTSGGTIAEAAAFFIALERACQTQLLVESSLAGSGLQKTYVGDEEAQYTKDGTGSPEVMYMQFLPEYQYILAKTGGDFLK